MGRNSSGISHPALLYSFGVSVVQNLYGKEVMSDGGTCSILKPMFYQYV